MACQVKMSQSVLNFYQHVLIKQSYIYHLHHCFRLYQRVRNRFPFMSLIICFATSPVSISVVFVWPYPCLFTILESGHMWLNYLAAGWSVILKGRLCLKQFSLHNSWSKFADTEMVPRSVNFLCCCAVPCALWCPCVYQYHFFPPCARLQSLLHTVYKKNHHFSRISDIL